MPHVRLLHVQIVPDPQALAQAAAQDFVQRCEEAVQECGFFTVCLSGGSTPAHMFDLLAKPPFSEQIPWRHVLVFWGDERFVPRAHPDNNCHMAYKHLLNHVPIPPENVYPIPTELSHPQQAAIRYQHTLRQVFARLGLREPAFHLLHLGMGPDGHTASLFPHNPLLQSPYKSHPWVAACWAPHLNAYRMTLTPWALTRGQAVIFLVAGANKSHTLRRILRGPVMGTQLPAQSVWLSCPRRCYFMLDEEAARLL